MTTGSGDSRMFGSAPIFGDATQGSLPRTSAVMPETPRAPGDPRGVAPDRTCPMSPARRRAR